jgi:hypothetical protein
MQLAWAGVDPHCPRRGGVLLVPGASASTIRRLDSQGLARMEIGTAARMSALGQKRTLRLRVRGVRLTPESGHASASKSMSAQCICGQECLSSSGASPQVAEKLPCFA